MLWSYPYHIHSFLILVIYTLLISFPTYLSPYVWLPLVSISVTNLPTPYLVISDYLLSGPHRMSSHRIPTLNFISLSTWSDIVYSISQQFGFCHFLCQSHHLDSSPNHIILKSAPFLVRSFPIYSLPYRIGSPQHYSESI